MNKKMKFFIASLVVVALLVGVTAVTVQQHNVAADSLDIEVPSMYRNSEERRAGEYYGIGPLQHETIEAVSELLGISPEEISEQREEGKSLLEIAQEQGVNEDTLVEAIMAATEEAIEKRVAEGKLTQERADQLFEGLEQKVILAINSEGNCYEKPAETTAFSGS